MLERRAARQLWDCRLSLPASVSAALLAHLGAHPLLPGCLWQDSSDQLLDLQERLELQEQRQQQMIGFLATALQHPGLVQHLVASTPMIKRIDDGRSECRRKPACLPAQRARLSARPPFCVPARLPSWCVVLPLCEQEQLPGQPGLQGCTWPVTPHAL